MYIEKHEINGETYVKLDELNELLKSERKAIAQRMKKNHAEGEDNTGFAGAHSQLTDFARKVNMSENGESYVIFTRDKSGKWEFLVDVIAWDKLPDYMKKAAAKAKAEFVTIGTSEIDEATLYETFEEGFEAMRNIVKKTGNEEWHMTKRWMFDTKDNREALLALFFDGGEEEPAPTRTVVNKRSTDRRIPARYTVWYRDDSDTTVHCMGFVRFEKGLPVFTNRPCRATWFVWRDMAQRVAEKCGDGFEVVDMFDQMTAEERLLRAIFREDGMDGDEEPEYHGDGTKAEDEDWDGDEE